MKRIILLHFISLMTLQLLAQTKTVTIHGIVKDTSVKRIEISHLLDAQFSKWENTELDVVDGAFNTSIQVPFPIEINISNGKKYYRKNFIYSDETILIDSAGELHIIGSAIQDEYEHEFLPFFESNDKVFDSILNFNQRNHQKYGEDFPKLIKDSANLLKERFGYQRTELLREYLKRHPDSYVALWDVSYYVYLDPSHQHFNFEKLFSSFSNQMQQLPFINVLKEKLRGSDKMQAGLIFPNDFFKGHEQMQTKIKENNQYYLIDVWYSHCAPCIRGFPKLREIYNQFHSKGFDIVSISVDQQKDEKDYVAAITKNKLAWNHIWDKDGVTAQKFNINYFPTFILLDKKGKIINYGISAEQLEAFLKENL
jgi:thiol-disulfide isomerase/thioredoxin